MSSGGGGGNNNFLPTRVIFCSDQNQDYIFCWPLVAQLWRVHHNTTPTLFFVSDDEKAFQALDRTHGEVILFPPLPKIPTSFQAQVLRLLAPAMYPDDICVISDIDLFLLKTNFFTRYGLAATHHAPNSFFSLNRYSKDVPHCSLTYQIARGSTFAEVFGVATKSIDSIRVKLAQWGKPGNSATAIPWSRDETLLTEHLKRWNRVRNNAWRQLITPGLWGRNGQHLIVTRFNGCALPSNPATLANIVEYEPFHPLSSTLALAEKIFRAALPEFQWPAAETIRGWYRGVVLPNHLSRHPEKRGATQTNARPRLQVKVNTGGKPRVILTKTSRPRLSMLRRRR